MSVPSGVNTVARVRTISYRCWHYCCSTVLARKNWSDAIMAANRTSISRISALDLPLRGPPHFRSKIAESYVVDYVEVA